MCSREDDPSVIDEPVTMDNQPLPILIPIADIRDYEVIPLPVINRHRSIGEPVYEVLRPCANPNCACKGPSFRNSDARTMDESED